MRIPSLMPMPQSATAGLSNGSARGFSKAIAGAVEELERKQQSADQAILAATSPEPPPLHETMLAIEEADLALRTAVQVRNKVVEDFQQIMNMQV